MSATSSNAVTSDQYQDEYKPSFVDKWDELIDWEGRADGESDFFGKLLRDHNCQRVIDAAAGTGYHAITLARDGFDVLAADGAEEMIDKTRENARTLGIELATQVADWRWLSEQVDDRFDALLCLGNAFTHLFTAEEREQAMQQFYQVLRPGGIVIIDQRNYDSILDEGFDSKHKYYYTGNGVDASPEEISEDFVRFRYAFPDGQVHHLTMYPIRQAALKQHMLDAGFTQVDQYGDFQPNYRVHDPDFVIQVGRK
jgi:SAM-dependent methyltransferase